MTLDQYAGDPDLGYYGVLTAPYGGGADNIIGWNGGGSEGVFEVYVMERSTGNLVDGGFSFVAFQHVFDDA